MLTTRNLEPSITVVEVPNLDCMPIEDLRAFMVKHAHGRARAALGLHGRGSVIATRNLSHYAANKLTAMQARQDGRITLACFYEGIADAIYTDDLPAHCRW